MTRPGPRRPRRPRRARPAGRDVRRGHLAVQSGALGILEANHYGPPGTFDDEIEIVGSDAILRLAGIESLSFGYRDGPALTMFRDRRWSDAPVPADDWESSVKASVIAYLDAVTAGHEPPVTGAAALEAIQLIHRIYETAAILGTRPGIPDG